MSTLCTPFVCIKDSFSSTFDEATRQRVRSTLTDVATSVAIQAIAIYALNLTVLSPYATIACGVTCLGFAGALIAARLPIAGRISRFVAQLSVVRLLHEIILTPLIHELGHATAGLLLFRSSTGPRITLSLLGRGATRVVTTYLSPLGELVGKARSKIILAAGGPIASVAFTLGMFAWSAYQTDQVAAERFAAHGLVQWADEIVHATTSIFTTHPLPDSNDFESLRQLGGIQPTTALGLIVILPVIQLIWLNRAKISSLWSGLCRSQNTAPQ